MRLTSKGARQAPALRRWLYRALWAVVFVAVGILVWRRLIGIEIHLRDMEAYWRAALRLQDGLPLYDSGGRLDGEDIYRHAPWFAIAWIPLTQLPKDLVGAVWVGILAIATVASLVPLIRTRTAFGYALAALFASFLAWQTAYGNTHPLIIASLVYGVRGRGGPLWIALAASLKGVPILYAMYYAARGEWRRFWMTVGLTAVLVAPMLLFDLSDYPFQPGNRPSLLYLGIPVYVAAVVAAAAVAWLVMRRNPPSALFVNSWAVVVAVPRILVYDLTYLLVGAAAAVQSTRSPNRRVESSTQALP